MSQMRTLSVSHRLHDDLPDLSPWRVSSEPYHRIPARPKRLRKPECRELVPSTRSLPSIHVHIPKCRCSLSETELQQEDDLLAAKISALSKTLSAGPARTPAEPTPSSLHILQHTRSGSTAVGVILSLTRLFSAPGSNAPPPPSPLQADLCLAVADLDIDKVAQYLVGPPVSLGAAKPLPVNAPNHLGYTPLMAAVRSPASAVRPRAQLEMVRFLVDGCGADVHAVRVDRVTGVGESVLSMACAGGLPEVVRFLVGRGAAADRRLPLSLGLGKAGKGSGPAAVGTRTRASAARQTGLTALHVAVLADRPECVKVLVTEGKADVNAVFDAAAFEGLEDVVGLKGGAGSVRQSARSLPRDGKARRPRHPVSALHLARCSPGCTRVLLQAGASVRAKDGYGRTALHWAAESGDSDVVRLLLDAQPDLSGAAGDGTTPLDATEGPCGRPQ